MKTHLLLLKELSVQNKNPAGIGGVHTKPHVFNPEDIPAATLKQMMIQLIRN